LPIGIVQGSFLELAANERLRNRQGEPGQLRLGKYRKVLLPESQIMYLTFGSRAKFSAIEDEFEVEDDF
jgi:hypothetical protein